MSIGLAALPVGIFLVEIVMQAGSLILHCETFGRVDSYYYIEDGFFRTGKRLCEKTDHGGGIQNEY